MQQKETAAAQAERKRLDHCECRSDRYRGVERVAAARQDLQASLGGEWMRGIDRLLCCVRRCLQKDDEQKGKYRAETTKR